MRHLKNIRIWGIRLDRYFSFVFAALTGLVLSACEGSELYNIDAPDWISEKVDSIENANKGTEEVLEGMQEDVYTIGNTDYTSGWWSAFSKYYVIADGQKWNAQFNLNINPDDNTYYKNFALVITNDYDREASGSYKEYGAYRFDATSDSLTYNSQWGDYLWFKYTQSNLLMSPDASNLDANVQKLGGKVTLTVDRSRVDTFYIKITNGTVTKTYTYPHALPNLNADASNTNIRCFLVPEGSYINFLSTNIVPIGGLTSANDKNPVSMVLNNVPETVERGADLNEAMSNISATVTFEEGVTKEVPASELLISAIPNMDEVGEKDLIVIYNKTFKGENCSTPIYATAKFRVENAIASIAVTSQPTHRNYYYYTSDATSDLLERTMAFDPTGLVVEATHTDGTTEIMDNSKLSFTAVPAKAGSQTVTISTENGCTATTTVTVAKSQSTLVQNSVSTVGATDNSTAFTGDFSDYFTVPMGETREAHFTNYSSLANNWNNFVVELYSNNECIGDVRADNYGWGTGYSSATAIGTQGDWATWLSGMNGADVHVYVTNVGNGTCDIQAVMNCTDGNLYTQCYLGFGAVTSDLQFRLTVDNSHLVFANNSSASKKKASHTVRRAYRRR